MIKIVLFFITFLFILNYDILEAITLENSSENSSENICDTYSKAGIYSFNAYFSRENNENISTGDNNNLPPPYYTLNNIDFADLKGEIAFFDKEILQDNITKNNRPYGIDKIDKWLIKYKPFNTSNGSKLYDNYISIVDNQTNATEQTINDNTDRGIKQNPGSIGYQNQTLSGNRNNELFGVWLATIGDCLNKPLDKKCKGEYSKNCMANEFNEDCLKTNIKLNKNDFHNQDLFTKIKDDNTMVSGVCDDDVTEPTGNIDCQIVAEYVGTVRLDDLGYTRSMMTHEPDKCTDKIHNKLRQHGINEFKGINNDKGLPFWEGENYETAFKLLSDEEFWCKDIGNGTFDIDITNKNEPCHKINNEGNFI